MRSYSASAVLFAGVLLAGPPCSALGQQLRPYQIGQTVKDLALKGVDGATVRLADFEGQAVLLSFFSYG